MATKWTKTDENRKNGMIQISTVRLPPVVESIAIEVLAVDASRVCSITVQLVC